MSTTFEVFPSISGIPTFQEVTSLATAKLRAFLAEFAINAQPRIDMVLHTKEPDKVLPTNLNEKAVWSQENYAWFTVDSVAGGTDAYYYDFDLMNPQLRELNEEVKQDILQKRVQSHANVIKACLVQKHSWTFRRSVGQSAIVTVAYGLIANSLAELTQGFIYSDDGAWDYQRFPALPSEFETWYFRPQLALDRRNAEWAESRINSIEHELKSFNNL